MSNDVKENKGNIKYRATRNFGNLSDVYKKIENVAKLKLDFVWQKKPKINKKQSSKQEENEIV